jgi:hypothetical protein
LGEKPGRRSTVVRKNVDGRWSMVKTGADLEIDGAEFALLDSSIQATCAIFSVCPPEIIQR